MEEKKRYEVEETESGYQVRDTFSRSRQPRIVHRSNFEEKCARVAEGLNAGGFLGGPKGVEKTLEKELRVSAKKSAAAAPAAGKGRRR